MAEHLNEASELDKKYGSETPVSIVNKIKSGEWGVREFVGWENWYYDQGFDVGYSAGVLDSTTKDHI